MLRVSRYLYVFLFGFDKNRVTYEARFMRTRLGVLNESEILSEKFRNSLRDSEVLLVVIRVLKSS